jgi:mannosyltransferase
MLGVDRAVAVRLLVIFLVLAASAYPEQRRVRGAASHDGANYRQIAAFIRDNQQPGDAVVYGNHTWAMQAGVTYYLGDAERPRNALMSRSATEVGRLAAQEFTDPAPRLRGIDRLWLLVNNHPADPASAKPALRHLLNTEYRRLELWRMKQATIALYVRAAP